MSHFSVLVITDQQPDDDALAAILQPWHEYECTGVDDEYVVDVDVTDELVADHAKYGEGKPFDEFVEGWSSAEKRDDGRWYHHTNPNAKWDWWVVGGRWSGLLRLKCGEAPILGRPGVLGSRASDHPLASDQAMMQDIDIDALRNEAREEAVTLWDQVHQVTDGLPAIEEWAALRERVGNIEVARAAYWAQPAVAALKAQFPNSWSLDDEVDATRRTRDEFGQRAADASLNTFAVVKDGSWFERGKMGWWALVSDEKEEGAWTAEFRKLLDGLEPTAWLTVVDCHI
ncbi:hypothetical protein [Pelagerythrobacter aerophilus]|uniref:Uncharacterized protein n=1 Tax=Pelagerythrobacter aerophilus TaxID=2306995 RepID=A0A418NK52_9SPHN|nr:hypothetical protein [Pelagerythrobacter aerophilus]RIV79542.1 hypothetical protein D2V04_06110 [Pelagerythrobacter aerophilus]